MVHIVGLGCALCCLPYCHSIVLYELLVSDLGRIIC